MSTLIDNILLVDDDSSTNFLNEILIKKNDVAKNVEVFNNGMNIIEYLGDEKTITPDAILLDLNMPIMDGWEVLGFIENTVNSDEVKCKIVILTASQNPDDREKAKNYDCIVGFMNKPVDIKRLKDFLS